MTRLYAKSRAIEVSYLIVFFSLLFWFYFNLQGLLRQSNVLCVLLVSIVKCSLCVVSFDSQMFFVCCQFRQSNVLCVLLVSIVKCSLCVVSFDSQMFFVCCQFRQSNVLCVLLVSMLSYKFSSSSTTWLLSMILGRHIACTTLSRDSTTTILTMKNSLLSQ